MCDCGENKINVHTLLFNIHRLVPFTGTIESHAGKSCKQIQEELSTNYCQTVFSGAYWITYNGNECGGETAASASTKVGYLATIV